MLVSTVPLIAICKPCVADWTSVQDLPAASTTGVPEAVVIFVPFGLGGRSGPEAAAHHAARFLPRRPAVRNAVNELPFVNWIARATGVYRRQAVDP